MYVVFVFLPAQMNINAGSNATLVSNDKLLKVSFSVQAQTPIAKILKPINQKITLNPKITYLRQQETSLWFLRRRFDRCWDGCWWCPWGLDPEGTGWGPPLGIISSKFSKRIVSRFTVLAFYFFLNPLSSIFFSPKKLGSQYVKVGLALLNSESSHFVVIPAKLETYYRRKNPILVTLPRVTGK